MKKIYIQPSMATFELTTEEMIAESTLEFGSQTTGDAGITSGNDVKGTDNQDAWGDLW